MEELKFKLTGSCQFKGILLDTQKVPFVNFEKGRLIGVWQWQFDNGTVETTHVSGAVTTQVSSERKLFLGIIKINMPGMNRFPSATELLFLSYELTEFRIENNKATIVIEGHFTGGTGQYADVSGELTIVTVNGLIKEGTGRLIFAS